MLRALKNHTWNLEPHAIGCSTAGCVANLFDGPDGAVLAVVGLPESSGATATVLLSTAVAKGRVTAELLQVGRASGWAPIKIPASETFVVPVTGGVALLRLA